MVDATLRGNLDVVFVLNRPFFHACYKGMWMCLVDDPNELPDDLVELGLAIDQVIEQRFSSWGAPFRKQGVAARYSLFLKSPIEKERAMQGKIRSSTLVERLHNDVHGGLPSLGYYRDLKDSGGIVHAAKELCIIGHEPLYRNLRFAISKRFPKGPVTAANLFADPFAQQILTIYNVPD
jgi:hypothetical protein